MIHEAIKLPKATPLAAFDAVEPLGMDITPIIHPSNGVHADASRTFWSATANALYIVRRNGEDIFGATPDFAGKLASCPDLVEHGRRGPIGCEADALAGLQLWRAADAAAARDRPTAPVAFHAVGWLPTNVRREVWNETVLEWLDRAIVANGMIADYAIHALADERGGWVKKPHVHAVLTGRFWKGSRIGQPQPAWLQSVKQRTVVEDCWIRLTMSG
ncbi:MAG: MobA/MobL family protein [Sphingomonas sp.]|uniref:MobA/MobL family protein n=1 Tax=Sphingomonas sp. TaxID=28214 RepID=UPI001AC44928|nr:MobA/MobL family protein [Sphingomonas sp.]MBN8816521.1 MobA/MobL family protein [Sphingomonas sp.]